MTKRLLPLLFLPIVAVFAVVIVGCSKDEDPIKPPEETKFIIRLKAGQTFIYDRWKLKMDNTKNDTSKSIYTTTFVGSTGSSLSGYTDYFRRNTVDSKTGTDETFIRVEPTNGDVMVHGFQYRIFEELIKQLNATIPGGIGNPTIAGKKWDIIGSYTGTPGTTTWNITQATGELLSFNVTGLGAITLTVWITGKYAAKDEVMTVGTKSIKMRKSTITTAIDILGTKQNILVHFWFSDDPNGQIKLMQESAVLSLGGFFNLSVPGEVQELSAVPL